MKKKERISTDKGEKPLEQNPFQALNLSGLPEMPAPSAPVETPSKGEREAVGKGARLEMRRIKAGKGGKTVTEVRGIASENLGGEILKRMKKSLGTGGTFKNSILELQGDVRDQAEVALSDLGFRVVRSGG